MISFESFIQQLESFGVADVLLPFLLVFAIVFAVLNKAELFGKEAKNINVIISLVLGLSVVIPHVTDSYPAGSDVVDIINVALPQVSLVALAFLMLMILIGVFGASWHGKSVAGIAVVVSVISIFSIFGGAAGWWDSEWVYEFFGPEAVSLFVMLIVFGLIIWFITKPPSAQGQLKQTMTDWGKWLIGDES